MDLIAAKAFPFGGKRRRKNDRFSASTAHARLLLAAGLAHQAPFADAAPAGDSASTDSVPEASDRSPGAEEVAGDESPADDEGADKKQLENFENEGGGSIPPPSGEPKIPASRTYKRRDLKAQD